MSNQSNAAYLAGFMDGEGSFSIVKTYQIKKRVDGSKVKGIRYHLHVKITNTNKEVLDWIVEHFGGQLSNKKQVKQWKPKWDLTITGNQKMENFILSILPYLIIKKKQAQVALDFARLHGQEVPEERDKLRHIMLQLNNSSQPHFKSPTTNTSDDSPSDSCILTDGTFSRVLKIESELIGDYESELTVK